MRALLAFALVCVAVASAADAPDYVRRCLQRCRKAGGDAALRKHAATACKSFEHVLPKPALHSACKSGYSGMKSAVCGVVCEFPEISCDASLAQESRVSAELTSACSSMRARRPSPAIYDACVVGHREASIKLCDLAKRAEAPFLAERRAAQDRAREQPEPAGASTSPDEPEAPAEEQPADPTSAEEAASAAQPGGEDVDAELAADVSV